MTLLQRMHIRAILSFSFLWLAFVLSAQNVNLEEYYKQAEGKSASELKTALHEIAKRGHVQRNYLAVAYDFFEKYDLTPEGYIWDMYDEPRYARWSGSGMNREHNLPKSWFGVKGGEENNEPIGCDYHNLYPSNAEANSAKSNYPLGETAGGRFKNDYSKVGTNTYPGYSGVVFEPADEYKGDFARCYMYMVTRYEDNPQRWTGTGTKSMLVNNTYPTFSTYAVNLLMEWHHNDPVSKKETDRNDNLYKVQGNRNPFIDYPDFAEFIWGGMQGEAWSPGVTYEEFKVWVENGVLAVSVNTRGGDAVHYEIFGVNGMRMASGTLDADNTVSVEQLPAGMYIVAVYSVHKRYVARFVR